MLSIGVLSAAVIAQGNPAINLIASPNPANLGETVTLTATVPSGSTGKVTFYDGTTILGISPISGVQATLTTVLLPSGARSLRAYYAGDDGHAASISGLVAETVKAMPSLGFQRAVNYAESTSSNLNLEFVIYPTSTIVGDFNGDGKQDIAATNRTNGTVSILIGNGDGTFRDPVDYAVEGIALSIAMGDFNGDGKPDLATTNNGGISIFIGIGDGTFQQAVLIPNSNVYSSAIAVGDFNGDGKADLVYATGLLTVLLGNGDGTFQTGISSGTATHGVSMVVADFNGDGKADVATENASVRGLYVYLGNGDGTFQPEVNNHSMLGTSNLTAADLNGDGQIDLVASDVNLGVYVTLGNGDGSFQTATQLVIGATALAVGDVNGDGKQDLVTNAGGGRVEDAYLLLGNGDGTFQKPLAIDEPSSSYTEALADFNGDGVTDLAIPGFQIIVPAWNFSRVTVLLGGAAPDLSVSVSHGDGLLTQGQVGAVYTIAVANAGNSASAQSATVIDQLPAGLTAISMLGSGWNCVLATLTCTTQQVVAPGASFMPILLTVNVGSSVTGTIVNTVTVSSAGDSNAANNTAADSVMINANSRPIRALPVRPCPDSYRLITGVCAPVRGPVQSSITSYGSQ